MEVSLSFVPSRADTGFFKQRGQSSYKATTTTFCLDLEQQLILPFERVFRIVKHFPKFLIFYFRATPFGISSVSTTNLSGDTPNKAVKSPKVSEHQGSEMRFMGGCVSGVCNSGWAEALKAVSTRNDPVKNGSSNLCPSFFQYVFNVFIHMFRTELRQKSLDGVRRLSTALDGARKNRMGLGRET